MVFLFLLFCHKDRWAGVSFMGLIVNPAHGHDRKGKERGKGKECLSAGLGQEEEGKVTPQNQQQHSISKLQALITFLLVPQTVP